MGRTTAKPDGYSIEASATFQHAGDGYVGRLVVRRLPEKAVVLQEEVLASGRLWPGAAVALDAAYARGLQFVRRELTRTRLGGRDDGATGTAAEWPPCAGYSLAGWQFDRNGDVQLPPSPAS